MTTKKGLQLHRKEVVEKEKARLKEEARDEAEKLNVTDDSSNNLGNHTTNTNVYAIHSNDKVSNVEDELLTNGS